MPSKLDTLSRQIKDTCVVGVPRRLVEQNFEKNGLRYEAHRVADLSKESKEMLSSISPLPGNAVSAIFAISREESEFPSFFPLYLKVLVAFSETEKVVGCAISKQGVAP